MNPRLPQSVQWTAVPAEFLAKVHETLSEAWQLPEGKLKILTEGRIYPEEIVVRIGLLEGGRLAQANFEISREIDKKTPLMDQLTHCFDASFTIASEHLSAGEHANTHLYPLYWKELKHQGKSVFFQFSTTNSALEAEADRLLGVEEGLFNSPASEDEFVIPEESSEDQWADGDDHGSHLH